MANYQSQYTGAQIDQAVGKALAGGGGSRGYTITVNAGTVTEVYFADGTTASSPSGKTFDNVTAFRVRVSSTKGMLSGPVSLFDTVPTTALVITPSYSVSSGTSIISIAPLADGVYNLKAGGGSD